MDIRVLYDQIRFERHIFASSISRARPRARSLRKNFPADISVCHVPILARFGILCNALQRGLYTDEHLKLQFRG
jgi:hypothetical protein